MKSSPQGTNKIEQDDAVKFRGKGTEEGILDGTLLYMRFCKFHFCWIIMIASASTIAALSLGTSEVKLAEFRWHRIYLYDGLLYQLSGDPSTLKETIGKMSDLSRNSHTKKYFCDRFVLSIRLIKTVRQ